MTHFVLFHCAQRLPDAALAMKALAARAYADLDDIALLAERLRITDVQQVESLCERIYPDEPLSERARLVVADVLENLRRERHLQKERGHDPPGLER